MRHRRATGKPDANEADVADKLRDMGCIVDVIDRPADLLCWHPRAGLFLVECKGANKYLRGRLQTEVLPARAELGYPWYVIREGESVTSLLDLAIRNFPRPSSARS